MTSTLLEFRDLSFARGERLLLNQVSFRLKRGDMVAIVGPNGVGKTTLLKLVSRLLRPSGGEILLYGKPLSSWSRRLLPREVALVPQELDVPFDFEVQELVLQGRVPHQSLFSLNGAGQDKAVQRAMQAVDVVKLRHRHYSQLSGGERQRVKIAIGLAQEPKLMLLDEPTQHLDIGRQIELLALLRQLNQNGMTIIAAVHDLHLVAKNFPSVILLTPEPAWFAGTAAEVLRPEFLGRAFCVEQAALSTYAVRPVEGPSHGDS